MRPPVYTIPSAKTKLHLKGLAGGEGLSPSFLPGSAVVGVNEISGCGEPAGGGRQFAQRCSQEINNPLIQVSQFALGRSARNHTRNRLNHQTQFVFATPQQHLSLMS